jgi:hypothetical protein
MTVLRPSSERRRAGAVVAEGDLVAGELHGRVVEDAAAQA